MDLEPVIREFLAESQEGLQRLDLDVIAFENDPSDTQVVGPMLRVLHTLKGTAGVLGYLRLEQLAHAGESLLCAIRDEGLAPSQERINALLALSDAVRAVLARIEADRDEGEDTFQELQEELNRLQRTNGTGSHAQPAPAPLAERASPAPEEAPSSLEEESESSDAIVGHDRTVRLDVELLDRLMDTVGELVLVRNQLQRETSDRGDRALQAASQRLGLITSELQEQVMKTRLQPISHLWKKLPRYVRNVAQSCNKEVEFETEGDETELDRSVLEAIADPIVHLIRNAVDHGLESPEERRAGGKPPRGTLKLRAFHEGGYVHVLASDDGRGIDAPALGRRAVELGFLTSAQAERLSQRELLQLAFRPGVSTAAAVTNLSGRGVGMDVVKTNVELIGGSIEVDSRLQAGTTFTMRIPLTLAIVPALLVSTCEERYAIPQANLQELICLRSEQIEYLDDAPFYRLREALLPLLDLSKALGLREVSSGHDEVNVVVVQHDAGSFGMIADEIGDTEEIVVKPLGRQLRHLSLYAGATVLGDGRVSLILDVAGIALHAALDQSAPELLPEEEAAETRAERTPLLLLRDDAGGLLALALSSVARLEEFSADRIELAGGRSLVQYRSRILPLLFLEDLLGEAESEAPTPQLSASARITRAAAARSAARETLNVVVYESGEDLIGIAVDEIADIVSADLTTCERGPSTRPGVSSTAVINGQIAEVLELDELLALIGKRPQLLSWSGA